MKIFSRAGQLNEDSMLAISEEKKPEKALDYEVIKSRYSEICRPKDMNRNLP